MTDLKTKPSGLARSGEVARDIFRYCSSVTRTAHKSELHLMLTLPCAEHSFVACLPVQLCKLLICLSIMMDLFKSLQLDIRSSSEISDNSPTSFLLRCSSTLTNLESNVLTKDNQ